MARATRSVSVILPYYNRVESLRAAVQSVVRQSHADLRLYLVNDGSTDGSRAIARTIRDSRIEHIDLPTNSGVCFARNAGLSAARTELVAFMDSDDEWWPTKLELQVASLTRRQREGEGISVLGCGWRYQGHPLPDRTFAPGPFTHHEMLRGVSGTGTPMLLVDRSVAAPGSFDATFASLEERDFVLSCLSNGSLLGVLPEVLVDVTRGRSDHVANADRTSAAWERFIEKYAGELANDDELRSFYHFRAAREHVVAGNRRRVRGHLGEALGHQGPRRTIHLILGAMARTRGLGLAQRVAPL